VIRLQRPFAQQKTIKNSLQYAEHYFCVSDN
jgi:hypothetical protein